MSVCNANAERSKVRKITGRSVIFVKRNQRFCAVSRGTGESRTSGKTESERSWHRIANEEEEKEESAVELRGRASVCQLSRTAGRL